MMTSDTSTRREQPTLVEAARREQIVKGTIAAVNELGYHRASLSEIARRAGVAKSALVYYFGSREALLMSVIDQIFTQLDDDIEAAVAEHSAPVDRLNAYARAYTHHVHTHRQEMAAGIEIVLSHRDEKGTPLYLIVGEDDRRLLSGILEEGIEKGDFRGIPLPVATVMVEGLIDLVITEIQRDADADLTPLAEEIMPFILRGLGADPHPGTAPGKEELPRLDSNQQPAG